MCKNVSDLKNEYRKINFRVNYPVLDIGGGDGSFLKSQSINNATIMDATENISKDFKYIRHDITQKLPINNIKYKTIFIMETLEHINNPLYLLGQVFDILDNDGICYIAIPYTPIGENLQHVCRWKLKDILDDVAKIGFNYKILEKRRRFKGLGIFLPYCWIVLSLTKRKDCPNNENKNVYNLNIPTFDTNDNSEQ